MIIFKSIPEDDKNYYQVNVTILHEGRELEIDMNNLPVLDKTHYRVVVSKLGPDNEIIKPVFYELEGTEDKDFLIKLRGHLEWTKGNFRDRELNWRYYQGEGMAFLGTTMQLDYFDMREGPIAWSINSHHHEEEIESSTTEPEHVKLIKIFAIYNHDTGESFNREGITLIPYEPEMEPGESDERSYWEYLNDLDGALKKKRDK